MATTGYRSLIRNLLSAVLLALAASAASPAWAEKRVALVIGVAKYTEVPLLANPVRDATAVANIFKAAGFDTVRSERDLGVSDLRRAVREFSDLARDADMAVVYYAGHGIEVDGTNYLVPADAKLLSDFDIEDETLSLDRVLKAVDPARRLKLVILDACRDNPFSKTMKRSVATRSVGRGLAKIEPNVANTLIAFAARAGAVASDGDGGDNGPFASALVKYITEPGLDLRLAFGRVRDEVLRTTGNRQEPFVYGSLGGETMSLVPPVAGKVDPDAAARVDFEFAAQVGSKQGWETFLGKYPKGFYADLARAQRDRLSVAEDGQAKADAIRLNAERLAAEKSEEMRKQLEEQSARQADETRRKLSEQAKKELDEARRQVAEQAKRELDEARRQLTLAREQADAARQQVEDAKKQTAADAQRQAAEAAERKADAEARERKRLASLTPPDAPAPPTSPPVVRAMDPADVARLLQVHLKRVGCDPGTSDGNWTEKSRHALDKFNQSASTKFDTKLASLDALDGVRAKTDRVCPLICGSRQRAEGERCVQISCEKNYVLTSSGVCEKRPEPAPRREVSARVREPAAPKTPSGGGGGGGRGGGKCFSFNGKTYCE